MRLEDGGDWAGEESADVAPDPSPRRPTVTVCSKLTTHRVVSSAMPHLAAHRRPVIDTTASVAPAGAEKGVGREATAGADWPRPLRSAPTCGVSPVVEGCPRQWGVDGGRWRVDGEE